MKKFLIVFIAVLLLLPLIGCESDEVTSDINDNEVIEDNTQANIDESEEDEDKEANDTPSKEEVEEKEEQYPAPLTGILYDEKINSRVVGVMVNNHPDARPQTTGLDDADIVYEVLAEGRITRFVAIYHSKEPELIGSVRSIRPYYIDIINGFDALIAHSGASTAAYTTIFSSDLPDLDEIRVASEAYWRDNSYEMPHNLYTSIAKIRESADKRGYRTSGYIPEIKFINEEEFIGDDKANSISVKYDTKYEVEYKFNEGTKLYERYINGEAHIDSQTKKQLTAKNIMVIETNHKVTDSEGRREVDVYGPGEGYLFQNGIVKEITWERKDGVIRPYIDEEEQGLLPGQTWVLMTDNHTTTSYK